MTAVPAPEPAPLGLVERLRGVHLRMVDAVLGGDGLGRVAQLAADAAGDAVAIVVPRLGVAAVSAEFSGDVAALCRYAGDRAKDRSAQIPRSVLAAVPIASGDEVIGTVLLLADGPSRSCCSSAPDTPAACRPGRWRTGRHI